MSLNLLNLVIATTLGSFLLTILLFYISKIFPSIIEHPSGSIRKIHKKAMIKIGGISLLAINTFTLYYDNLQIILILIFSTFFLLLGILADMNKSFSALQRLILFFLLIIVYLLISDNFINHLDSNFATLLIQNSYISFFIFSTLCIALFVNGANLIDGLHGLKIGSMIIICISLYVQIPDNFNYLKAFLIVIITSSICLFLVNFILANIKSGDTGAYYIGFVIASISIYIHNLQIIHSFHLACILSYPIMEVTFTYFRRLANRENPFKPDSKHIHSRLYKLIRTKLNKISPEFSNRITSIILLSLQVLVQIFAHLYEVTGDGYVINFFIIMFMYAFIYIFLSKIKT